MNANPKDTAHFPPRSFRLGTVSVGKIVESAAWLSNHFFRVRLRSGVATAVVVEQGPGIGDVWTQIGTGTTNDVGVWVDIGSLVITDDRVRIRVTSGTGIVDVEMQAGRGLTIDASGNPNLNNRTGALADLLADTSMGVGQISVATDAQSIVINNVEGGPPFEIDAGGAGGGGDGVVVVPTGPVELIYSTSGGGTPSFIDGGSVYGRTGTIGLVACSFTYVPGDTPEENGTITIDLSNIPGSEDAYFNASGYCSHGDDGDQILILCKSTSPIVLYTLDGSDINAITGQIDFSILITLQFPDGGGGGGGGGLTPDTVVATMPLDVTGADSGGIVLPLVVFAKGISMVSGEAGAISVDIATIALPAGLERYNLRSSTTQATSVLIIDSATGMPGSGNFQIRTAADGGGISIGASSVAADVGTAASINAVQNAIGSGDTLYIHQIFNQAATDVVISVYLTLFPLP